jgi:hypothetical protein
VCSRSPLRTVQRARAPMTAYLTRYTAGDSQIGTGEWCDSSPVTPRRAMGRFDQLARPVRTEFRAPTRGSKSFPACRPPRVPCSGRYGSERAAWLGSRCTAPRTLTVSPGAAGRYPLADSGGNDLEVCGAVSKGQRSKRRTLHHDTTSFVSVPSSTASVSRACMLVKISNAEEIRADSLWGF